jgi:hypothetical protein
VAADAASGALGDVVWETAHTDGAVARGVAASARRVYGLFSGGPVLEMDAATGRKLRAFRVEGGLHMALGMTVQGGSWAAGWDPAAGEAQPDGGGAAKAGAAWSEGVAAISDSGRVGLYRLDDGRRLRTVVEVGGG